MLRVACVVVLCWGWVYCHPAGDSPPRPAYTPSEASFKAESHLLGTPLSSDLRDAEWSPRADRRRLFVVKSPCVTSAQEPCDGGVEYEFDLLARSKRSDRFHPDLYLLPEESKM